MKEKYAIITILVIIITLACIPLAIPKENKSVRVLWHGLEYDFHTIIGTLRSHFNVTVSHNPPTDPELLKEHFDVVIHLMYMDDWDDETSRAMKYLNAYSTFVSDGGGLFIASHCPAWHKSGYEVPFNALSSNFGVIAYDYLISDGAGVTENLTNHELMNGVWRIYHSGLTLKIIESSVFPLIFGSEVTYRVQDPILMAATSYGLGRIVFFPVHPNELYSDSEIEESMSCDNLQLYLNIVHWLAKRPVVITEVQTPELKNLQDEINRLQTDKENLETEIAQLQQQKEEVINDLPLVKTLKQQIDDLNSTYISLKSDYDSLQTDYSDLKSKYDELTADLGSTRNLNYLFIITTIIFIATTLYLTIRKPKVKST